MSRVVTFGLVLLASLISSLFFAPSGRVFPVLAGIMVGTLVPFVDALIGSREDLRFLWYSIRYSRRMIRVSVSYLFRIKIDDKYLLIRSTRAPVYIPVGGVYKTTPTANSAIERLGIVDDNLVALDVASRDDLRIRIPGRNLARFMRWFNSGKGRETDHWREFYEELVAPGIVDATKFAWITHDFVRRRVSDLHFSLHAQALEVLIADIYELLPTAEQLDDLQQLKTRGNPAIEWLDREEIQRLGATPGKGQRLQTGSPVTQWIL